MRWILPILLTAAAVAQKPAEEATIKVDVDVVSVYCSVRDKKGGFIKNLDKSDFTILEDGKQQPIKYFSRETNVPLTIGLLVDTSKSQEALIESERRAASAFFQSVLREKDMAFLIQFGAEAELLQDYTNSVRLLRQGLNALRLNAPAGPPPTIASTPGTLPSKVRGTILFDAVYLAAAEKLKGEVGRKAIVLITDGMDYGSRVKLQEAVAASHKSDVVIYSIYYADSRFGYFASDGDLRKMSEETGGRVFHVRGRYGLEDIFKEIQDEMRSTYTVGYSPTNAARDGAFRKIEIRASNKDHKVQARKGYYAAK